MTRSGRFAAVGARHALLVVITTTVLVGCGRSAGTSAQHVSSSTTPSRSAAAPDSGPTPVVRPANAAEAAEAASAGARVSRPNPCARNQAPQLVLVNVADQHMWMCARRAVVRDTPVTTGAIDLPYDATPTGRFRVQARDTARVLTLINGDRYTVRYWIPFDAPLFGFHDSPWQTMRYGSQRFRTHGSHGCVHVPLAAMRFLYRWVRVGALVRVRGVTS